MLAGILVLAVPAQAQFSPGPLSTAHAALDGATKCFRCHAPRKATTDDRCLRCHRALGQRIDAGAGFHGRLPEAERSVCGKCHLEHGGRDGVLIRWPQGKVENFDHALTGWRLEGAHARTACRKCHRAEAIQDDAVRKAEDLALERTFLGLSSACRACHDDPHHGQFARRVERSDCTACHTSQEKWKATRIDHDATRFPLRGKHRDVACARCHPTRDASERDVPAGTPGGWVRYRPLPHAACTDCHRDPHKGRYGNDCTRCHDNRGWKHIRLGSFDHDKTDYPLRGAHRQVRCDKCHAGSDFKKPLAFARCTDCHETPHAGQLVRHRKDDCKTCHRVEGFRPADFDLQDHRQTRFPLEEAHRAVACVACHPLHAPKPAGNVRFRYDTRDCQTCHQDPHAGQFARRGRTDCRRCHAKSTWKIARFDHDHTRFKLEGAHARAACASCHRPESRGGARVVRYRPMETRCRACHDTPVRPEALRRSR